MIKQETDIISRIKKCLKLADKAHGATEAEAATALAMARKLMDEHNISMSDVEMQQELSTGVSEVKSDAKAYTSLWEKKLARVMDALFSVRHYYSAERAGTWTGKKMAIVFLGVGQDPLIAKESFNILSSIVRKMGNKRGLSGSDHRDYCLGVVTTLLTRAYDLKRDSEVKLSACKDLVVVKDQLINTHMAGLKLRLARVGFARHSEHYDAGRKDGMDIDLNMRRALK